MLPYPSIRTHIRYLPPSDLFRKLKLFLRPPNDETWRRVALHPKIIVNNNKMNLPI